MAKLVLVKEDKVQKKWALVLQGKLPTIEQFKRNPSGYTALPHGLYDVQAPLVDIWDADNGVRVKSNEGVFKILYSNRKFIDFVDQGLVKISGGVLNTTGRFDKRGSEILFIVGKE